MNLYKNLSNMKFLNQIFLFSIQNILLSMRSHKEVNEAYFNFQDYRNYLSYNRDPKDNKTQQNLVLARALFIQKKYRDCINVLQNYVKPLSTNYLLYERQTLLLKAYSIQQSTNHIKLKQIISAFHENYNKCQGQKLGPIHKEMFQKLQGVLNINHQSQPDKAKDEELLHLTQSKQLTKIQGFPVYLIEIEWIEKWKKYLKEDGDHPGPITNFSLQNHFANVLFYEESSKQYLNQILIPFSSQLQDEYYRIVTKKTWNYLQAIYGGYAIKRVWIRKKKQYYRLNKQIAVLQAQRGLLKNYLYIQDQKFLLQTPCNFYWHKDVLRKILKNYPKGQLRKKFVEDSKQYYMPMIENKLVQPISSSYQYQYIQVQIPRKNLKQEEKKNLDLLYQKYDMQKINTRYIPKHQTGLTNLKNSCYLGASLQCLANIKEFSQYFVSNQYLEEVNILDSRKIGGSNGKVTCAFAQVLKALWCGLPQKQYGFAATNFKRTFGQRFPEFDNTQQQDANQFLSFLLNCLHDDLNKNYGNKYERKSMSSLKGFSDIKRAAVQQQQVLNKSLITDLLRGYQYSTIECENCKDIIHRFQLFFMLNLQLPPMAGSVDIAFVASDDDATATLVKMYVGKLKTVKDILNLSKQHYSETKTFCLIAINKRDYKFQDILDEDIEIAKVLKISLKNYLMIYQLPKYDPETEELIMITHSIQRFFKGSRSFGFPRIRINKKEATEQQLIKVVQSSYFIVRTSEDYQQQRIQYEKRRMGQSKEHSRSQSQQDQQQTKKKIRTEYNQKIRKKINKRRTSVTKIPMLKQQRKSPFAYEVKVIFNAQPKNLSLADFKSTFNTYGQIADEDVHFNLHTCLKLSTQKQRLQQQGWQCEKCKDQTIGHKKQSIYSTGDLLIITLKRFNGQQKIRARIDYPIRGLDLSQFIHDDHSKNCLYDLESIILHSGTLNYGHYKSICKDFENGKWYRYDDQSVFQITEQDVINDSAYILFYRKQ